MDLSKLASKAGSLLKSEAGQKIVGEAVKGVKEKAGLDVTSLIGLASKNADIIKSLGAIGAMKATSTFDASNTLNLVSQLKNLVTENIGKIDNNTFKTVIDKLLSTDAIKEKVEKIAGSGTTSFIKKAIAAFIEK